MVGTPFPKGHSGNPGGRPKTAAEVRLLAAEYTEEAILRLASLLDHRDPKVAALAANSLLDRAHGKPTQMMASDESMGGLIVNVNMLPIPKKEDDGGNRSTE